MLDLSSATLATIAVVGTVNVIQMFRPTTDSRTKFGISLVVAFIIGFVPADLGNYIATHIKDAIVVALAGSGVYKIAQQAGGIVKR